MKKRSVITVETDGQGRVILPAEVAKRYGCVAGAKTRLEEDAAGFRFSRSSEHLARIYVEPTNRATSTASPACATCGTKPPGG